MGIIAGIYDSHHGRDGLSVLPHVRNVTVVNADGPFEPSPTAPAVLLVPTNGAPGCVRAVPVEAHEQGKWLMKGHSFIATSDSRFTEAVEKITGSHFYGAVALHDRCEA